MSSCTPELRIHVSISFKIMEYILQWGVQLMSHLLEQFSIVLDSPIHSYEYLFLRLLAASIVKKNHQIFYSSLFPKKFLSITSILIKTKYIYLGMYTSFLGDQNKSLLQTKELEFTVGDPGEKFQFFPFIFASQGFFIHYGPWFLTNEK